MAHEYKVLSKLGEGAFGKVYRAQFPRGKEYAVKCVDISSSSEFLKVLQEPLLMDTLEHPHILHCLDYASKRNELLMVVFYCPLGTLRQLINRRQVNEREALTMFTQMADAVMYLHAKQVLHRDLKPDNILRDEKGDIKIGDLGIAKIRTLIPAQNPQYDTICGTYCYRSPEIVAHHRYSCKCLALPGKLKTRCELRQLLQHMLHWDQDSRIEAKDVLFLLLVIQRKPYKRIPLKHRESIHVDWPKLRRAIQRFKH